MTAQWIRYRLLHEMIARWALSCDPRLARAQAVFSNMATYRHPARLPGYIEPCARLCAGATYRQNGCLYPCACKIE